MSRVSNELSERTDFEATPPLEPLLVAIFFKVTTTRKTSDFGHALGITLRQEFLLPRIASSNEIIIVSSGFLGAGATTLSTSPGGRQPNPKQHQYWHEDMACKKHFRDDHISTKDDQ